MTTLLTGICWMIVVQNSRLNVHLQCNESNHTEVLVNFISLFIFQSCLCFSADLFYLFYWLLPIKPQMHQAHDLLSILHFVFLMLLKALLASPPLLFLSFPLTVMLQLLFLLFVSLFSFDQLLASFHQPLLMVVAISLLLFCSFYLCLPFYLLCQDHSSSSQTPHPRVSSSPSCLATLLVQPLHTTIGS